MIELKSFVGEMEFDRAAYNATEKELQERLYILLNECAQKELSCLILLEGWAASGKGDALKTMTARLDPRKFIVYTDESGKSDYPFLHPYWTSLPYHGKAQFLIGSWYHRAVDRRAKEKDSAEEFDDNIQSILNFERLLSDESYIILKFFLHISKDVQKDRMKKARKDGLSWVIAKADAKQNENYRDYKRIFEHILNRTDASASPWNIIPAENKYYGKFKIMEIMIKSLEARLGVDSQKSLEELKRVEEMA
ncbi:MAG: hypothetical protein JNM27_17280 [Leptospirales bacterium]|nr:hypothetical protein [Leptospirales bacterium]